jgi:Domain of Unknown Function (DUF1080)
MNRFWIAAFAVAALALAGPGAARAADTDKWVPLFNGKDLDGWTPGPDDKAKWVVVDGTIVGSGPAGHLYTVRDDYQNFRYRVEAMISDGGNSGQYFRVKEIVKKGGFPTVYEAQINSTHGDPIRTGSLYPAFNRRLSPEDKKKVVVLEQLHKPDEWFTQEVIAVDNHIIIKVNGKTTVDFVDEKRTSMKGRFALQQHNLGSVVKFRKIEVIELPSTATER